MQLQEAFPDNRGTVCSAFFTQPDSSSQNWSSLESLVNCDDTAFWCTVAWHEKLPLVVDQLVRAVDESHSTSVRNVRVTKKQENTLIKFLLRFMTTLAAPESGGGDAAAELLSVSSVSSRFSRIIPSSLLLPVSLILLRVGGPVATTAITSFVLQCPVVLTQLPGVISMWCDSVTQVARKCVAEAKRGRYQRKPGDIMPLLERSYRLAKHLWALSHAAPYLIDYMDDGLRAMTGLRIIVDVISPLLHHFVMTSDTMAQRRPLLVRANSMLVNAAVGCAALMTMLTSFQCSGASSTGRKPTAAAATSRCVIASSALSKFDESCSSFLLQYCRGVPGALVRRCPKVFDLIHNIAPLPQRANDRLADWFEALASPIPNSKDFSAGCAEGAERLTGLLIVELVNQGFHLEELQSRGFLTSDEARRFGARTRGSDGRTGAGDAVTHRESTSHSVQEHSRATSVPTEAERSQPPQSLDTGASDPNVELVQSVLPHLTTAVVKAALLYYHHDVEHLINEAVSGNLPPHLQSAPGTDDSGTPPPPASAAHNLGGGTREEFGGHHADHDIPEGDMERYVSGDCDEEIGGGRGSSAASQGANLRHVGEEEEDGMLTTTLQRDGGGLSDELYMDDGFREQTFEFLYDDERDDAEDGEAHVWGAVGDDLSDDGDDGSELEGDGALRPLNVKGLAVPAATSRQHHGDASGERSGQSAHGKWQPGKKQQHSAGVPQGTAAQKAPVYALKKTFKDRKGAAGGAKSSLARSVKKGGFDS